MKREQTGQRLSGLRRASGSVENRAIHGAGIHFEPGPVVERLTVSELVNQRGCGCVGEGAEKAVAWRRVILGQAARGTGEKLRTLEKLNPIVVVMAPSGVSAELRGNVRVEAYDVVAPRVRSAAFGLVVVLQILSGARRENGVREREEVEHRLSPSVDPVLGNHIAWKRGRGAGRVQGQRIGHYDQGVAAIHAVRVVAPALQCGRHAFVLVGEGCELFGVLLRCEEEEPGLADIEMFGNVHGAAQTPSRDVVPVTISREAGDVVEEVVGIEFFVPVSPPARTVEFLGATLGDHLDGTARVAPEFRLEVRSQHLDLADGIDVGFENAKNYSTIFC